MALELPRMLVSDDDPWVRETIGSVFREQGFRVWMASDGHEALQLLVAQGIHVVLSDVRMPGLSGLELVRAVRHWGLAVPFVFLSAEISPQLLAQAARWHVQEVLPKPVRVSQLRQAVHRALAQAPGLYGLYRNP